MIFKHPNLFKRSFGFLLLTVILFFVTLWYFERWFFENILEKLIEESNQHGIEISHQGIETTGFPETLRFTLKQVACRTHGFEFYAPAITIDVGLFFPLKSQFEIQVKDTPVVSFADYRAKGESLHGIVNLEHFRFKGVAFELGSFFVLQDKDPVLKLRKGHVSATLNPVSGKSSTLAIGLRGNLGGWFQELALQADTDIRLESKINVSHINTLIQKRKDLAVWKAQGGEIEIERFSLIFPQMDIMWSGRLYLDDAYALAGDFDLNLQGFQKLLDLLSEYGVNDKDLTFLKLSLIFLKKNEDGGFSLPFQLKKNRFYVLGVALPFTLKPFIKQDP